MFGALFLGFMGTQNVQADGILTGTLSSSTITAGTSSISITGVDSFDPTGTQVGVLLFTGACPHSGTAIFGPVYATTVSGGGYTQNIPTSSLSPGSYCVHAWSTHTQVSVDDPLQVVPWLFIETTTIVDLHYPSQVVLQNGVAQATITFTLSYSGLPPGDAILFGVYLNSGNPTLLDGSGASTPDVCTSSWGGQSWPGKAACAVVPSSSSGTESATLTITSAASPQQYSLFVGAIMVDPSSKAISSSMSKQTFTITVVAPSTPATDWGVSSVSLSPPNPNVGDLVTFSMVVTALSSQASFPQNFAAVCQIDGVSCGGGTLTYPGPLDTPFTVSAQTPWIATVGTHTLTWGVATIPVGLDPDKSNNMKSITFTVAQASSQQTTTASSTASQAPDFQINVSPSSQTVLQGETASYSVNVVALNGFNSQVSLSVSGLPSGANGVFSNPSATPDFASTLTVILSGNVATGSYTLTVTGSGGGLTRVANLVLTVNAAVVTQTSASSTETSASSTQTLSDLMSMIEQNQLLILGAVILLAAVIIAIALRSGRKTTSTTT